MDQEVRRIANSKGQIVIVERFTNGKRQDGPNGEPAYQGFDDFGHLRKALRYAMGVQQDGPDGEPAYQMFDDAGQLTLIIRYTNGGRQDGPNGEPAFQEFDSAGNLKRASRYCKGFVVKSSLSAEEIAAINEARRFVDVETKVKARPPARLRFPARRLIPAIR